MFVGIATIVHLTCMVVYKRVLAHLGTCLAAPLVHKLVASADAYRNALVLGANLFTAGLPLQQAHEDLPHPLLGGT